MSTKIICISDTHEQHEKVIVPDGDILIHAGDFTYRGEFPAVSSFAQWMKELPHQYKICIAGNHELSFQTPFRGIMVNTLREAGIIYLEDSGCEINDLIFYGSPHQPEYHHWAFNLPRDGQELKNKWNNIPDNVNVLITHGPPYGILDEVSRVPEPQGCKLLKKRVMSLPDLKVHVFGHMHKPGGEMLEIARVKFVNAAICDDKYDPSRKPVVIDL